MIKIVKRWWSWRHKKYYSQNFWHVIAEALALILVLVLIALFLFFNSQKNIDFKFDLSPINHQVKILEKGSLLLDSSVNKGSMYFEDTINLNLKIVNSGKNEIKDLNLMPNFLNNNFQISSLKISSSSSELVTTSSQNISINSISAGEEISLSLLISLKSGSNSFRSINWFLKGSYVEQDQNFEYDYVLPSIKIITDLKVNAAAYYHSPLGDQLGSGPIPPLAGLPTTYWIFFNAENNGNKISNFVISAKLANNVLFTNSKFLNSGDFIYDENQKRVTWKLSSLSENNSKHQAGFEVQINPSEADVGHLLPLLNNITYIALDTYTNDKISKSLQSIDTNLTQDLLNKGQGAVKE